MNNGYTLNHPKALTCPECGGTVSIVDDGPVRQYVCHIGHVLSGEAMLAAQADRIEGFATGLLAALNERQELCRQLIEARQDDRGVLQQMRIKTMKGAEVIRDFLNNSLFN
jgi:two-component system, chemotaxis family, protein-glutamate methylesterase/glutaminase